MITEYGIINNIILPQEPFSALHLAAYANKADVCELLLKHGAYLEIRSEVSTVTIMWSGVVCTDSMLLSHRGTKWAIRASPLNEQCGTFGSFIAHCVAVIVISSWFHCDFLMRLGAIHFVPSTNHNISPLTLFAIRYPVLSTCCFMFNASSI
jgi:ankyrin repeat protein